VVIRTRLAGLFDEGEIDGSARAAALSGLLR
jgi:hypothetical protein